MSEQSPKPAESELIQSPEYKRAFRTLHAYLTKMVNEHGGPAEAKKSNSFSFKGYTTINQYSGMKFQPNARQGSFYIHRGDDRRSILWTEALGEKGVEVTGKLGYIEVGADGGSHPSDLYVINQDTSIDHFYRAEEYDGLDEDGYQINWRERIDDLGRLSVGEIEELQLTLESANPTGAFSQAT